MRINAATAAANQHIKVTIAHRAVNLITGAGDDFGFDARLCQRGLYRCRQIQERLIGQNTQRGFKSIWVARFGQQRFGARHVKLVARSGNVASIPFWMGR